MVSVVATAAWSDALGQAVEWPVGDGGNGHFYKSVMVGGISWDDANAAAVASGGHLATITSAGENAFVHSLVAPSQPTWASGPWLGGLQPAGSTETACNWQWVTGEPFSYTNWAAGQPDNGRGNEDRLQFSYSSNAVQPKWNDILGDNHEDVPSYIVEYDSAPQPAPLTITIQVDAYIDGTDYLVVKNNTLQWHHTDWAAVGRHYGNNFPTIITTRVNGQLVMDAVQWFPQWPLDPPDEMNWRDVWSSVFDGLSPGLVGPDIITASITALDARSILGIVQYPSASNDYELILKFDDNGPIASTWYSALITIEAVPEPASLLLLLLGAPALIGRRYRRSAGPRG